MPRIARVWIVSLLGFAACGGANRPAPEPVEAEAPTVCEVTPAVAATRRPKPSDTGCMDQASMDALTAGCNADVPDPDACHRLAACGLFDLVSESPDPTTARNIRAALRISCDAGIAEGCRLRVGVAMNDGAALPADGCADLVRGCQLGDEQACFDCRNTACR